MIGLRKKGDNLSQLKNKRWKLFLIAFGIILIILVGVFIFINYNFGTKVAASPTCGDGSFYNSCSLEKPFYCNNGILIENSSVCGCPSLFSKVGDSCIYGNQSFPEFSSFDYVLDGNSQIINFTLYHSVVNYLLTLPDSITYTNGQQPLRSDFTLLRLNEPIQESLLSPFVKEIENLAPNDKTDQARIAVSLVQNIPWGSSGRTVSFENVQANYSRYPYQVLYDNQGLCSEKSELLAFILRDLGYGVALFYYPLEDHEALGIKCPVQDSLDGTGYCFVED